MLKKNLPIVSIDTSVKDIIQVVSSSKMGLAIVMSDEKILGIITDGDIRRAMESQEERFFSLVAMELMTREPKRVDFKAKLMEAQKIMAENKVNSLIVTKKSKVVGVVQIYDLGI
jgi:arabinose-5-phosphate isomerase